MNHTMTYLASLVLTVLLPAGLHAQLQKGLSAYDDGNYDEALAYFQDALLDDPENPLLHYNAGTASYQKERYEEALASFEKALTTKDIALQQRSYYNRGNVLYRMEKYVESIEAYKKALDLNPQDSAAKHNLELVRAKLKEMSDQQPQEQQQQQDRVEPSEFARQLKAESERLMEAGQYKDAYHLMIQGKNLDPTVEAYGDYISRLGTIAGIEERG